MNSSFSLRRFGVISRINSARWSVWFGGSRVGSWSLNGSLSRYCSISARRRRRPRAAPEPGTVRSPCCTTTTSCDRRRRPAEPRTISGHNESRRDALRAATGLTAPAWRRVQRVRDPRSSAGSSRRSRVTSRTSGHVMVVVVLSLYRSRCVRIGQVTRTIVGRLPTDRTVPILYEWPAIPGQNLSEQLQS